MEYKTILYEQEGDIVIVTLNRPEVKNALSREVVSELHGAFDRVEGDPSARCIVLTGAGDAFSAGADQGQTPDGYGPVGDPRKLYVSDYIGAYQSRDLRQTMDLLKIFYMSKPVIAAVNGWCLGFGFWQALACDITIASDRAVFGQPEVRHNANSSFLFAALCGWKTANRYALTGDHFDAQEALRIGVVNEVVPHDELLDKAKALAHRIALVSEPSVRYNKYITTLGLEAMGLHSGMVLNSFLSAFAHSSNDAHQHELFETRRTQGVKAYLRKRDDPFQPEPFGPRSKNPKKANGKPD